MLYGVVAIVSIVIAFILMFISLCMCCQLVLFFFFFAQETLRIVSRHPLADHH